jgi:hypothetical protein
MKKAESAQWKIFIGPVEIAGIAGGLVSGFSKLGIYAEANFSYPYPFQSIPIVSHWIFNVWQLLGAARAHTSKSNLVRKAALVLLHNTWGWLIFIRSLPRFNAFFFLGGQTITNSNLELWFLKCLRKKIIFIYTGSDSRPPYIDGGRFPVSSSRPSAKYLNTLTRRCKKKLGLHEKFADYLVNSPASAQFHERYYINWFALGIPKLINSSVFYDKKPQDSVRIVHSPSNSGVKGTSVIIATLDRLRDKGYLIDWINIQGKPNSVVLDELSRCDFVIDQLYSDTPLATFATEAAFFGKPAVVGGFFASDVSSTIQADEIPPSLFVLPEFIELAIERMIIDNSFRCELGQKAKQFVESKWAVELVAGRYLKLLENEIPDDWWRNPKDVSYVGGCGMPLSHAQLLISDLIKKFGVSALQVSDKPKLEQAFVSLASEI